MAITALPTPPSRQDPTNFATRGDAFMAALPGFVTEANALQSDVNAKQQATALSQIAAAASQATAAASQSAASVSANLAAASTGAVLWVSGTNYAAGFVVYSALTGRSYRRLVAGAGTTDPSADTANWRPLLLDIDTGYPTTLPSLNLDFANSKALDPRITFSRASTATYYDGKTVAKAEENLLTYSQDFDSSTWVKARSDFVANNVAAPDSTSTADTLTINTTSTSGAPTYTLNLQGQTPGTYTYSVHIKQSSKNFIRIGVYNGSNAVYQFMNVVSKTTGASGTSGTGFSFVSSSVAAANNGFVRVAFTFSVSGNGGFYPILHISCAADGDVSCVSGDSCALWGAQLEQRSSVTAYTPTTGQPITNYIPALQTAPANAARFHHNPITSESLGLLIEEQRTNLVNYSGSIGTSPWYVGGLSCTQNSIAAPDGSLSATLVTETTETSSHSTAFIVGSADSIKTLSIFAKKGSGSRWLQLYTTGSAAYANFDLSSGLVSASSICDATIQSLGNGWYRCSIAPTDASNFNFVCCLVNSAAAVRNFSYTGDGYSSVYIWGAQLEQGTFATSYIPTTTAQVTRAADSAIMVGANYANWFRQDEGTFYHEFMFPTVNAARYALSGSDIANLRWSYGNKDSSNWQMYDGANSVLLGTPPAMVYNKLAVYSTLTQMGGSLNGSTAVSGLSNGNLLRNSTSILIGDGNTKLNGTIKKISYYPKRLSNSELQALTA